MSVPEERCLSTSITEKLNECSSDDVGFDEYESVSNDMHFNEIPDSRETMRYELTTMETRYRTSSFVSRLLDDRFVIQTNYSVAA